MQESGYETARDDTNEYISRLLLHAFDVSLSLISGLSFVILCSLSFCSYTNVL